MEKKLKKYQKSSLFFSANTCFCLIVSKTHLLAMTKEGKEHARVKKSILERKELIVVNIVCGLNRRKNRNVRKRTRKEAMKQEEEEVIFYLIIKLTAIN